MYGLSLYLGFQGTLCQYNPDDCVDVSCNYGTCVDGLNNFTCECQAGYSGVSCNIDIDECQSQPCQYGGTCVNQKASYQCRCPHGTTGDFKSYD